MSTEIPSTELSVLDQLRAQRAAQLHHVEIHRSGDLVADAGIAELRPAVVAALHTATLCSPEGVEAALVDEVEEVSAAAPGSSALLGMPAGAEEMLARVVEVFDDVEVHRDGDLVIATATVPEPQ